MILFDSSALISMGMTCSFDLLKNLRKDYGRKFLIPASIKKEIVDNALNTRRFKYQGYRLKQLIDSKVLEVIDETAYQTDIQRLSSLANSTFSANGKNIEIIHSGELALLVIAHKGSEDDAVVVDERTTRLLVETPEQIQRLLESKLHTTVSVDQAKLASLKKEMTSVAILRSVDLALAAHLKGYLEDKDMLDGLLWALKFAGCAISGKEIKEYLQEVK